MQQKITAVPPVLKLFHSFSMRRADMRMLPDLYVIAIMSKSHWYVAGDIWLQPKVSLIISIRIATVMCTHVRLSASKILQLPTKVVQRNLQSPKKQCQIQIYHKLRVALHSNTWVRFKLNSLYMMHFLCNLGFLVPVALSRDQTCHRALSHGKCYIPSHFRPSRDICLSRRV